jgi:DnaJ-domain-containing protein 1/ketosteroid isomerase-like protein
MTEREDVLRLLGNLATYRVLPPAEALPANDEAFQGLLVDLARGEGSSHADALREVATRSGIAVDELCRRAQFLLICLLLPTSGTHYEVLGVAADATPREIRKRWAVLIRRYHPDRLGGAAGPTSWLDEQARRLIEAYQILKDSERRRQYDAHLRSRVARFPAVISNQPGLRVTRFTRAASQRWVPAGIAAVGIAAFVWAHTRPAPGPLPTAPLPAAPKLLEAWGRTEPAQTAVPPRRATEAQISMALSTRSSERPPAVASVAAPPVSPAVADASGPAGPLLESAAPEGQIAGETTRAPLGPSPATAGAATLAARPSATPTAGAAIATPFAARPTTSPLGVAAAGPTPAPDTASSLGETLAVIEAFRAAYERKDLAAMMRMFAAAPRDRNVAGRREVEQLYAHNFVALDQIRYELSQLEIRAGGGGEMLVQGQYRIRAVRSRNATQPIDVAGPIRWLLRRESDALRVVAVEYEVAR